MGRIVTPPTFRGRIWPRVEDRGLVDPKSIANGVVWYNAAPANISLDGSSKVQAATELFGGVKNLAQATPGFRPSIGTLGSRPAFSFDGIDDLLVSSVFTTVPQPFTMLFRSRWSGVALAVGQAMGNLALNRFFMAVVTSVSSMQINAGAPANSFPWTALPGGTPAADIVWTVILNGATTTVRANGTVAFSGAQGTVGMNQISLGGDAAGGEPYSGLLTEFITYARILGAGEITALESYLKS